jgi:hypothetical protein
MQSAEENDHGILVAAFGCGVLTMRDSVREDAYVKAFPSSLNFGFFEIAVNYDRLRRSQHVLGRCGDTWAFEFINKVFAAVDGEDDWSASQFGGTRESDVAPDGEVGQGSVYVDEVRPLAFHAGEEFDRQESLLDQPSSIRGLAVLTARFEMNVLVPAVLDDLPDNCGNAAHILVLVQARCCDNDLHPGAKREE